MIPQAAGKLAWGVMSNHDQRPDPDALLARVKEEETRQTRGKLKVFSAPPRVWARPTPCWRPPRPSRREHGRGGRLGGHPRAG